MIGSWIEILKMSAEEMGKRLVGEIAGFEGGRMRAELRTCVGVAGLSPCEQVKGLDTGP